MILLCSQGWIDNLNGPSGLFIAVSSLYTYVIDLKEVERDYHRRNKTSKSNIETKKRIEERKKTGHHEVVSTVNCSFEWEKVRG